MDTRNIIPSVGSSPTQAVAQSSQGKPRVRVDAEPQEPREKVNSDAVRVSLTSVRPAVADEGEGVVTSSGRVDSSADEGSDAQNAVSSTQVKFGSTDELNGGLEMHFRVVDRQSGEVVREFPPENGLSRAGARGIRTAA